eukprot:766865-Hanusia_phi.AAC.11
MGLVGFCINQHGEIDDYDADDNDDDGGDGGGGTDEETYRKRYKSSLKDFVLSMNMTKVSKLFKYLKDVGHLSRHAGFLIVHKKVGCRHYRRRADPPAGAAGREVEERKESRAEKVGRAENFRGPHLCLSRLNAMKARDKVEKEELKKVKEKMEAAEERVMRNFRKRLSDRDQSILDKKVAEVMSDCISYAHVFNCTQMRRARDESPENIEDPELRDLYKQFQKHDDDLE